MDHIRQWWRQPDRYEWLTGYLASRRLLRISSSVMATIMAVLAVAVALTTISPAGPGGVFRGVVLVAAAGLAAIAVAYARRWPTRRQSAVYSVSGSAALAVVALAPVGPARRAADLLGLRRAGGLRGLGAQPAPARGHRRHCARHGAGLHCADGSGRRRGSGVATLLMSTGGLLTVPFGGQILTRLLWNDAVSTDPLTGLTNRRGSGGRRAP